MDEKVAPGAALKKLTSRASELGLIPANYAALFGFTDSIRSPRSHGAALREDEVEIGPAESLLMGNHARALLVYPRSPAMINGEDGWGPNLRHFFSW